MYHSTEKKGGEEEFMLGAVFEQDVWAKGPSKFEHTWAKGPSKFEDWQQLQGAFQLGPQGEASYSSFPNPQVNMEISWSILLNTTADSRI